MEKGRKAISFTPDTVFQFKDDNKRVGVINYELLKHSKMILDSKGNPLRTRPVQSWELIEDVMEEAEKRNLNYIFDGVIVDKNSATKPMTREEKKVYENDNTPIKYWVFNDLITRMIFPTTGDDGNDGSIAIAFNDYGIQVAFGLNTRICSNMSILGGKILRTYSQKKLHYPEILNMIIGWMDNLESVVAVEMEIMHILNQHTIWADSETIHEYDERMDNLIGKLYRFAVMQNYFDKKTDAPLNQSNVSKFCQSAISKKEEHIEKGMFSAWDLFNIGTSIIRPGNVDSKNIIDNSYLWLKVVLEMYNLSVKSE